MLKYIYILIFSIITGCSIGTPKQQVTEAQEMVAEELAFYKACQNGEVTGIKKFFECPAFTEREYFDNDLAWAMNKAYWAESGYDNLCERRTNIVLSLVEGSYPVSMQLTRAVTGGATNPYHVLPCKDGMCVDSTGVIADKYTVFPESDLKHFAYDIISLGK